MGYLLLLAIAGGVMGGYEYLDKIGLIKHTVETNVTAQGNWFVGESKPCMTRPYTQAFAEKKRGYAVEYFNCDDGPPHSVSVEFWGRKEQPEYGQVFWKCTRQADKFVCTETAGFAEMAIKNRP